MVQEDGGTRGGTFQGETDRCRESQGWTTACSSLAERDEKDQGGNSPKQAGSLAIVDWPQLLTQTCILLEDVMLSFSGVTFFFCFCFVFVFFFH